MDWSRVDHLWIIVMFLSAVWILILMAPIQCRGSIGEQVKLNFSKFAPVKKQTHLYLGVSKFLENVNFWVNYSFNLLDCYV